MPLYRLIDIDRMEKDGQTYGKGDTVELTAEQARTWGDRIESVPEAPAAAPAVQPVEVEAVAPDAPAEAVEAVPTFSEPPARKRRKAGPSPPPE